MKKFVLMLFFLQFNLIFIHCESLFIENKEVCDYISIWKFAQFADFQVSRFAFSKIENFNPYTCNNTYFKFSPKQIKKNSIIYLCYSCLNFFFKIYHPKIETSYILITGEGSGSIPNKWYNFLNQKKLTLWAGIHPDVSNHSKLLIIPEGYSPRQANLIDDDKKLEKIALNLRNKNKESLLYMNFTKENHVDRKKLFDKFKNEAFCIKSENKSFFEYLDDMAKCKFTLSPRGKGLDCFRTWEALIVGSIPIVKSSFLDPLYKGLPVLIVKDWDTINERMLNAKYKEITSKKYKLNKLTMKYWKNRIKKYRA